MHADIKNCMTLFYALYNVQVFILFLGAVHLLHNIPILKIFFVPLSLKTTRNNPTSSHNGLIKKFIYKTLVLKHN